jgi:hypothetical protein
MPAGIAILPGFCLTKDGGLIRARDPSGCIQADEPEGRKREDQVSADTDKKASHTKPTRRPKALDRWFDDQLNQIYAEATNEPLPDDLARLVSQLKARETK